MHMSIIHLGFGYWFFSPYLVYMPSYMFHNVNKWVHFLVPSLYIWVVLRKRAPMCDIELVALDLHIWVANRLVQCTTYTV